VYLEAAGAAMPGDFDQWRPTHELRGKRKMTGLDRREETFEAKFAHDEASFRNAILDRDQRSLDGVLCGLIQGKP
jgi:hypothetical protein